MKIWRFARKPTPSWRCSAADCRRPAASLDVVNGGGGLRLFSFLRHAGHLPARPFPPRATTASASACERTASSSPLYLNSLAANDRRLPGIEHRVDRPILLRHECADFLLALDDQPQRDGLHPARREAAPHLVPEQRRNLVAHDAVEHSPRLLRIHQVASTCRGCSNAARIALGVISLKVTRKIFFGSVAGISFRRGFFRLFLRAVVGRALFS